MLVPAGVLVLVVLGAIAVDSAAAFLAQRELTSAAAAAANDAAGAAVSEESFYRGPPGAPGRIRVDGTAARRVAEQAVEARAPRGITVTEVSVHVVGDQVCVALSGTVERLFAKAVPGVAHAVAVEGRATATAVEGPAGTTVAQRGVC